MNRFLVLLLVLPLCRCKKEAGPSPKSSEHRPPLLGYWSRAQGDFAYEFFPDGTAILFQPFPEAPLEVRYSCPQPSTLRFEFPSGGSLELPYSVSGDSMRLSVGEGLTYRRTRREEPKSDVRRSTRCASNLSRLLQDARALTTADRSADRILGSAFWIKAARSQQDLTCPFETATRSPYRGPGRRFSALGEGDWIGACFGVHPEDEVLLLRKNGYVGLSRKGSPTALFAEKITMP